MKFLVALGILVTIVSTSFGQAKSDKPVEGEFLECHIDGLGKLFFDGMGRTITELQEHLANNDVKHAKLSLVFPTPMGAMETVVKTQDLFDSYKVKVEMFKDREFKEPAFDDW